MANKPSIIQPGQVVFHGVEDFNAFINMFDTICFAWNITDDADKAKQLVHMFMGTAAAWYSRLEPAVKNSFAALVAAGRTEYVPTTLQDQIRDKLDKLQKLPYETMQTYIQRFQYLTSLMTLALTEEVLLSAFKRGLPDHIHNWLTLQKVNSLTGALTEARTYAQCEERGAQIPDPAYYILGLKGQVMINPYMSHAMGSTSAVPFIPGASLVIPQALPATPTAQPTAAATQANNTTTAQSPTFATTDQVAQLMVKLEQIHLNQTDPNRQSVNTATRGQVACTRCNGTGHTNDQCPNLQIAQGVVCTYCAKRVHPYEECRTRTKAAQLQPQVAQVAQVNAIGAGPPQANHGNPPQYNAQLQAPAPRNRQGNGGNQGNRGRPNPVCFNCQGPHYRNQCTVPRPVRCMVCGEEHQLAACLQFRTLLRDIQQPPQNQPPAPNANVNYISIVEEPATVDHINHIAQESVFVTTRSQRYNLPPVQEEDTTTTSSSEDDDTPVIPTGGRPVPERPSRQPPLTEQDPVLQMYRTSVPIFNTLTAQPRSNNIFDYDLAVDLATMKANISVKQLLDISPICRRSLQTLIDPQASPVRRPPTTRNVPASSTVPGDTTIPLVTQTILAATSPVPASMAPVRNGPPLPRTTTPVVQNNGASSSTAPPEANHTTADTVVPVHMIKHRDTVVPVTIDGHVIPDCRIDSGSSVNVIPLETMRALGLTGMRSTSVLLRMADGRNTRPVGEMKNVPTLIGEQTFLIDYIVMDMSHPPQFPLLLGVPWFVAADVHTSWRTRRLTFGTKQNKSTLAMYPSDPGSSSDHEGDGVLMMNSLDSLWHPDHDDEDDTLAHLVQCFHIQSINTPVYDCFAITHFDEDLYSPEYNAFTQEDYDSDDEEEDYLFSRHSDNTAIPRPEVVRTLTTAVVEELNLIDSTSTGNTATHSKNQQGVAARLRDFQEEWLLHLTVESSSPTEEEWSTTDGSPPTQSPRRPNKGKQIMEENSDITLEVQDAELRDYFTKKHPQGKTDMVHPRLPIEDEFIKLNISYGDSEPRYINVSANIPVDQLPTFQELFREYRDIFAYTYKELLGVDPNRCQHRIPLREGSRFVVSKPYRLNPYMADLVKKELDKLLECDFIYPSEETEWASPILIVPKKDTGKIQVCVDFRSLNQQTIPDAFPIPFTDMLLDEVVGSEMFSFMDGFSGYNQIGRAPEDQYKTTFVTQWGTFAYRVMLFGLQNAPATFQRYMMNFFLPLNDQLKLYLDDLCAHGPRSTHIDTLRATFTACRKARISLNPDKCFFGASCGPLLGLLVSRAGTSINPRKIECILRIPIPITVTDLQLECLGMIFSVQKFRHYLLGTQFVFHVDHQALRYIVNRPSRSGKLARWMLLLQEYTFTLEYKSGTFHINADYLSRLPGDPSPTAIDTGPIDFSLLSITTQAPWTEQIKHYLSTGNTSTDLSPGKTKTFHLNALPFTVISDTLYRMGPDHVLRRVLDTDEIPMVLKSCHSDEAGGHFSRELTAHKIYLAGYWWPTVHKDCDNYVKRCDACQRQSRPVSRGSVTVQFLHQNIISRFEVPITIITDNGTHFVNDAVAELAEAYGIEHRLSTPYHPQTNGQVERTNGILVNVLKKTVALNPTDWDRKLIGALWAYRTTYKVTTGHTPFQLVYGQEVILPVEFLIPTLQALTSYHPPGMSELSKGEECQENLSVDPITERVHVLHQLTEKRIQALYTQYVIQARRKQQFDQKVKHRDIRPNDLVLKYNDKISRFPAKFATKWLGPYWVQEVFDNGTV
ncbi:hypothetical protein R1sor_024475 [Riccia sorocarpa]|uniref:RNA-directed DNA polymerase n=1 Tax=Riccia sorocarpa TaxID=122646 RepID=A0ABD3GUK3_9MARC